MVLERELAYQRGTGCRVACLSLGFCSEVKGWRFRQSGGPGHAALTSAPTLNKVGVRLDPFDVAGDHRCTVEEGSDVC